MTYHPEARTNTFKVAIAIGDYEKALNPEVWPYRVAVRPFRQSRKDREKRAMEFQFGRSGGVLPNQHLHDQQQQKQQQQKQHQPKVQPPQQEKEVIETSNRYDLLLDMDNDN